MRSNANTKNIEIKGSNKVSQGQWTVSAKTNTAEKIKNNNQYKFFERF
ncbi:MAG: hypothetical protein NVS9B7_23930 [Flavisolibacter sp.]